ncbi:MAG: BamA/TamA family outer membrane protein, partial [Longimicrobiales bacterium]
LALGLVEAVLFTDVGQAWGPRERVLLEDLEFSPGIGVRFASPVGPIRLDLAYRFRGAEDLPVVTEAICDLKKGNHSCKTDDRLSSDEDDPWYNWASTGSFVQLPQSVLFGENGRGFQLHISIGQAF